MSLVFVNKYLLSGMSVKFDAPLFITAYQCVITVLCCLILRLLSKIFPRYFSFPELNFRTDIALRVMPLSVVFLGMISFNNLCLKHVDIAFYNVGRSLTTVFNVLLTYVILNERTSVKAIVCCLVIITGFIMGIDQEGQGGTLSVTGVVYGVLASMFVSLNAIYSKRVLPAVNGDIALLTYYNNLNAIVLFIPATIVTGEIGAVVGYPGLSDPHFWTMMTLSGVCGFAIGYASGLQIKHTSPLTHNISGTAKACVQTVVAVCYLEELKTVLWWGSNALVLLGSAAYTHVKRSEMIRSHNTASGAKLKQVI